MDCNINVCFILNKICLTNNRQYQIFSCLERNGNTCRNITEKKYIPISYSLVWPDRDSIPPSTENEATTLTITSLMRYAIFKLTIYNIKFIMERNTGIIENPCRNTT